MRTLISIVFTPRLPTGSLERFPSPCARLCFLVSGLTHSPPGGTSPVKVDDRNSVVVGSALDCGLCAGKTYRRRGEAHLDHARRRGIQPPVIAASSTAGNAESRVVYELIQIRISQR